MMQSVKKNYIFNLIYQAFLVIVPLVVTPYISRVLKPDGVGQYSYSYSIITYFTVVAALGFATYSQRCVAREREDKYEKSKIFWETILCRLFSVLLSFLTCFVLLVANVFGKYSVLIGILSINILAIGLDVTFLFQGNEKFGVIVFRNIIIKALSICSIFIFVKTSDDVWVYTLINSVTVFVSNLSLWLALKKELVKVKIRDLKPFRHLKGTFRLFIPALATTIYVMINKTFMGILIPGTKVLIENGVEVVERIADIENGYYDSADRLVKMALTVITSIGTVMISRNSHELQVGNFEIVKSNIYKSGRFIFMIGTPMTFGLILIASNLVPWFYGNGYEDVVFLLMMESPLFLIIGFSNLFSYLYLAPMGKDRELGIVTLCTCILNIILCCIFIPLFWAKGALIATLISEFSTTFFMWLYSKKDIKISEIFKKSWKYFAASILMFAISFPLSIYLESSVLNTFILFVLSVFIYVVSLFVMRDKLFIVYVSKALSYLNRIFKKIIRKK